MSFPTVFVLALSLIQFSSSFNNNSAFTLEEYAVFNQWKNKFKVNVSDDSRVVAKIVEESKKIITHNKRYDKGQESYFQKVWKYSFLNSTDRRKLTTGFNYVDISKNTRSRPGVRFRDLSVISKFQSNPPPFENNNATSLDWRDYGVVTPVQDQGYYCASCYAFSSTGALEAQIALKTGNITTLSAQQLIDCNYDINNGNWGCEGGYMTVSYAYLVYNNGINPASYYPYQEKRFTCRFNHQYSVGSINSFVSLQAAFNETVLKIALSIIGPIAVAVDAEQDSFYNYAGGIYYEPLCTHWLTHAMLLVGFGTDPVEGDYWLLKNSWGIYWGEEGYMKLKRNAGNHCGIGFYAVYPVLPNK